MKKAIALLSLLMLLTGCGAAETYETMADEIIQSVMAQPREISMQLPEEALLPAMESDSGTLYICKDYDVTVQTLESGDLEETIRQVSGYSPDELTIMQTMSGELTQYEFVWTTTTDSGEQVGRAMILDDGNYHYVLTTMADADIVSEYQEIWNGLFESFGLI